MNENAIRHTANNWGMTTAEVLRTLENARVRNEREREVAMPIVELFRRGIITLQELILKLEDTFQELN